jgi:hypothetical protein
MKRWLLYLLAFGLLLSGASCGKVPTLPAAVQTALPTVQAGVQSGVQTAVPAVQGGVQTVIPTLQAGAATALPAIKTAIPPQLRPGEGLPLPGTLVAEALNHLSQEDAALAIEAYARDVFSTTIEVSIGRSVTGDLNLPLSIESGAATALQLSGVTYFGLLPDGAASLSLASETSGGDLAASIQQASMGILSFQRRQTGPSSAEAALSLIHAHFPGLVNQRLVLDSDENGYTFQTKEPNDWTLRDGKLTLSKSLVAAGVSPGRSYGRINVWALVATGMLAAPFLP